MPRSITQNRNVDQLGIARSALEGMVGLCGAVSGGVEDEPGWVAGGVADVADRGSGGHRVLMTGWCGDRQLVWGAGIGPAAVFFALVTAFT